MISIIQNFKDERARSKARRIERSQALKTELLRIATVLAGSSEGALSQSEAEQLLSSAANLMQQCAGRLTRDELRLIGDLPAELQVLAQVVVGQQECSGYCNVNSTDSHVGPCLHTNGMIDVYGSAPVSFSCKPLISKARKELDRRTLSQLAS